PAPRGRSRGPFPGPGLPAHPAPLLRHPPARRRRRRPRGPGTARPRLGDHDPGVHAGDRRQAARGVRDLAPAGPVSGWSASRDRRATRPLQMIIHNVAMTGTRWWSILVAVLVLGAVSGCTPDRPYTEVVSVTHGPDPDRVLVTVLSGGKPNRV